MAMRPVSRRVVLGASAGAVGLAVAAGGILPALGAPTKDNPGKGGGNGGGGGGGGDDDGGGGTATGNRLFLPPLIGLGAGGTSLASVPVGGNTQEGQPTAYLGYESEDVALDRGTMPGPTIELDRGDELVAAYTNLLDGDSTVHWHGMVVPTGADGQPQEWVPSGESYTYRFTVDQRATMNWYHPHPHGHTAEQVALGLAGAVIIRDGEEGALDLPRGSYELPLIIRDGDLDRKSGALLYKPRSSGYLGKLPMVNGTTEAYVEVEPAIYRLRVLNGSNGRVMQLAMSDGTPFHLIGVEGGLLPQCHVLPFIDYGMAERLDILLDLRQHAGTSVALLDQFSGWELVRFDVGEESTAPHDWLPPDGGGLSGTATLGDPRATGSPDVVFSFDGMGRINGREFEMDRIDHLIKQGEPQVWRFTTGGNGPHPVHVHGEYFEVLSGFGGRRDQIPTDLEVRPGVFPWEDGLKDTVLLQDGETVDVMVRFDAFAGYYLMHCHKLEHEDAGMMLNFQVYDTPQPPPNPTRPSGVFTEQPPASWR